MLPLALLLLALVPRAGDGSLEAYLAKMRTEREAEWGRLSGRVQEIVAKFSTARSAQDLKKLHSDLDALGSEAAPLLLPFLDPEAAASDAKAEGKDPKEKKGERERAADEVAVALSRCGSPALVEELLHLSEQGSPKGRLRALRVLGDCSEKERAAAGLRALYPRSEGALRAECVRSLARLSPTEPLVETALADSDPAVVRAALDALAAAPHGEPLPAVLELARDPSRASPVLAELVRYFRVPGLKLDEDSVAALLRLAARGDLPPEARQAVLDGFPHFGVALTPRLRKELEPLLESGDTALREGALVALTLLKDARAKRELLKAHDDVVEKNKGWPQGYQKRGDTELKIGEYGDAARDYRTAIDLHGESSRLPGNRDLWVNLARAFVLDGKLKPAAETLEEFDMTSELRRMLKEDPDFAPLVEHPRYKRLFD